jgi:glucuronate isomerase
VAYIHDDFLLESKAARRLYHRYAAQQPIIDYHCHLPPRDVADDRRFANLFEIWLEGDHYKWRAMRASGVPERYCTGDADRAVMPPQSAVSLDASRAEALFRHRRSAR